MEHELDNPAPADRTLFDRISTCVSTYGPDKLHDEVPQHETAEADAADPIPVPKVIPGAN